MKTRGNPIRNFKRIITIVIFLLTSCFSSRGQWSFAGLNDNNDLTTFKCLFFELNYPRENNTSFSSSYNYSLNNRNLTSIEVKLDLENWMVNPETWCLKSDNHVFHVNKEEELEVEDWMLHEFQIMNFKNEQFLIKISEEEEKMVIEDWMMDTNHWIINDSP